MSSYTMQLRTYIEQTTQDQSSLSVRDRIEEGRKKLFDFDYPIFDENYRKVFETHFIRNFYMREIGFETEGLFKFHLETWLMIHMPYFNKLFESELLNFDPLSNTKMDITKTKENGKTQTDTRETNNTSNITGSSDSTETQSNNNTVNTDLNKFDRSLESNNPDSRLAITTNDGQGVIEYASKINEDSQTNSQTSTNTGSGNATNTTDTNTTGSSNQTDELTSNINETEDYIEHVIGKTGSQSYGKMIEEFRSSFIRIEKQMFNEMQELFMLVY